MIASFPVFALSLEPGERYWLAVRGIGAGNGRAAWMSANTGEPNGSEVYFRSEFFGIDEWTPGSDVFGQTHDTAWTLTFIPGPGGLALGLAAVAAGGRSRRRRR